MNTLTFTYTADSGGTSDGELQVTVPYYDPGDWPPPTTTSGEPDFTSLSNCPGATLTIPPNSDDVYMTNLNLAGKHGRREH